MDNQSELIWDYLWSHIDFEKELYKNSQLKMEDEENGRTNSN